VIKDTYPHPWSSGPGEILRHGLELLHKDSDTNRRLAMISIDNSVELMMKTYLGLPKRITGLVITRKEFQEAAESFPALLDALEKYASDKLYGIDLGTIEWYHRLRNELYHQGNGLTVERDKVEIYAELANVLFKNLFGYNLVEDLARTKLLGEFLAEWTQVELGLRVIVERKGVRNDISNWAKRRPLGLLEVLQFAHKNHLLDSRELNELEKLRTVYNLAAHGQPGWEKLLTQDMIERTRHWAKRLASDGDAA
jgi:hypothetical protein